MPPACQEHGVCPVYWMSSSRAAISSGVNPPPIGSVGFCALTTGLLFLPGGGAVSLWLAENALHSADEVGTISQPWPAGSCPSLALLSGGFW